MAGEKDFLKFLKENAPDRLQYQDDVQVPFENEPVATDFSGPEEREDAERAFALKGMLDQVRDWKSDANVGRSPAV